MSIGEDSSCLVWNSKGEIIKKFKGHIGNDTYFILAYSTQNIIFAAVGIAVDHIDTPMTAQH